MNFIGVWDIGIFDDDISLDIKTDFDHAIAEGKNVKQATEQILESFEDVLEDEDEGLIVYLALATLQLEKGAIQMNIRKKALDIIKSGQGLECWRDAGEDVLNKRKIILDELKDKLIK